MSKLSLSFKINFRLMIIGLISNLFTKVILKKMKSGNHVVDEYVISCGLEKSFLFRSARHRLVLEKGAVKNGVSENSTLFTINFICCSKERPFDFPPEILSKFV